MTFPHGLPLAADADVAVFGSGSAGATAAIAAARRGASVTLIERHGFLGGTSTAVLDTFYGFYTPGDTLKVVGGLPDEVVAELRRYGPVIERPNTFGAGTGITYHPEHLKVAWDNLTTQAGVHVLLYSTLQDVIGDDGRITEAILATKAGLRRVRASYFVDATGDADLCHFAGLGYELAGEHEPAQTLTTTFKMCNVNLARRMQVPKDEVHQLMAKAVESGDYELPRRDGSDHRTPIPGVTATIMTRLASYATRDGRSVNATDPELLTKAEIAGRRQAIEYVRFLQDRVPGYEEAEVSSLSTQIGVRETRRVYGDYRLTRDDVLGARQFDDQIALCGAPIEDHHAGADTHWTYLPRGAAVGVPYRTLLARDAQNVLVAGRCFSATHDAQASIRSMAQCMAMGHAAGTAAALATSGDLPVRDIDLATLRRQLHEDGAVLHIDDASNVESRSSIPTDGHLTNEGADHGGKPGN